MINVALIIVYYSGETDILECLKSFQKLNLDDIHLTIFLIDNSGFSKLQTKLTSFALPINYIKSHTNVGFTGGVNSGITKALESKTDYILLLNSDTIVDPDFLTKLIKYAQSSKNIGLISPKIYFSPRFEFHKKYTSKNLGHVIWYAGGEIDWKNLYPKHIGVDQVDDGQFDQPKEVEFATGCCMLINRETIDKVGMFDSNYFLYFEDVDYSIRTKKAGFNVLYYPKSFIWHKNASSSGKPGSDLHIYFQTRNRLYFASKYAPLRLKLHLYKETLSYFLTNDNIRKKASADFLFHNLGKGSFNI